MTKNTSTPTKPPGRSRSSAIAGASTCTTAADAEATATGEVLRGAAEAVRADALQPGITDVVVGVRGADGTIVAALTVPYVSTSFSTVAHDEVVAQARRAARAIERALGWSPGGHDEITNR